MTASSENLARRSLGDIMWTYLGVAIHAVIQIGGSIALARILGPKPIGEFAIVMIVCGSLRLIGELGLGSALIQKAVLAPDDVSLVFTRLSIAGGAIALLLVSIGAAATGKIFGSAHAADALRIVSVVFLLYPVSIVCSSILSRDLNRKRIQLISVIGYTFGYVGIGIIGALGGWGVFSLAAGFVAQSTIITLMLLHLARPKLRWKFGGEVGDLWRFGVRATGINALTWLVGITDNLIVAKLYGPLSLGIYSLAYNVVRTPTDQLVVTIQNVLLPASSRIQADNSRLARGYFASLDAVIVVTAPAFAGIAAVSDTFVAALYGDAWSKAAGLLVPLALAMPLHAINAVSSAVLWGSGNVAKELRLQFFVAIVFFLVVGGLAQYSLTALAWGVLVVYAIRSAWIVYMVTLTLEARAARIFESARTGIGVAPLVCAVLTWFDSHCRTIAPLPAVRLCLDITVGGAVWLPAVICIGPRTFSRELKAGLTILFANMPQSVRNWASVRQG